MKSLNKTSTKTFKALIDGLIELGDAHQYGKEGGSIMPAHVDYINRFVNPDGKEFGRVYSIAHYYRQNSDSMKDPVMDFLVAHDGEVYPLTFEQDGLPGSMAYQVAVRFVQKDDGFYTFEFNHRMQHSHTSFANQWLRNIKSQQKIKHLPEPKIELNDKSREILEALKEWVKLRADMMPKMRLILVKAFINSNYPGNEAEAAAVLAAFKAGGQ